MHLFVHMMGGFWIAITILWIALKIGHIEKITHYKRRALIIMVGSALIIGIVWEIFELVFKIDLVNKIGYWPYTINAVVADLIGGIIAFWYFMSSKKSANVLPKKSENYLIMPLVIKQ